MYFEHKLHLCSESPRLLVVMSPMNFKNRFMQYKSFLADMKASILFITDTSDSYYLGSDHGASIKNMIHAEIGGFFRGKEITFLGSSMSAYAALYHGLEFNANIIMSNPQLDRDITIQSVAGDKKNKMPEKVPKNLIGVSRFFNGSNKQSAIWYSCGHHKMDTANLHEFCRCKPRSCRAVVERVNTIDHKYHFEDVSRVYGVMDVLDQIRSLDWPDSTGWRVI